MSKIKIQKIGITHLSADAIVNAANSGLWAGGGVCGAIFRAAGHKQLQEACDKIGRCDVGSAVITDAFNLKAKYIIHAVGPQYTDGKHGEPRLLYSAYRKALSLAVSHGCRTVGFPLISAGIFGYPKADAWRKAIQACRDFIAEHSDTSLEIIFAVLDDETMELGNKILARTAPEMTAYTESASCQKDTEPLKGSFSTLTTAGKSTKAIFFHKPEEPYGFLSNWYPSEFVIDNIVYSSAEQYIMHQKCLLFNDTAAAQMILSTDDVQKQQYAGRMASNYDEHIWDGMRQLIALRGLTAKFSQNPELKEKLLDTGDAYLAECAVHDRIWACGRALTDENRLNTDTWPGRNILGFTLMEVRRQLRQKESSLPHSNNI